MEAIMEKRWGEKGEKQREEERHVEETDRQAAGMVANSTRTGRSLHPNWHWVRQLPATAVSSHCLVTVTESIQVRFNSSFPRFPRRKLLNPLWITISAWNLQQSSSWHPFPPRNSLDNVQFLKKLPFQPNNKQTKRTKEYKVGFEIHSFVYFIQKYHTISQIKKFTTQTRNQHERPTSPESIEYFHTAPHFTVHSSPEYLLQKEQRRNQGLVKLIEKESIKKEKKEKK